MDIFILAVSTAVLFALGYVVVWTNRAVRRVGPRRFARALGALGWAVLVAQIFSARKGKQQFCHWRSCQTESRRIRRNRIRFGWSLRRMYAKARIQCHYGST
jgi:hypothetical protein